VVFFFYKLFLKNYKRCIFIWWKCIKIEKSKNVKDVFFVNVWRKNIFDIYVTEYGTALTTVLPILFLCLDAVIVAAGTFER
jgi:hypothetical protein